MKDFKRKKTKGGKLLIRWKGPYTIVKLLGRGTTCCLMPIQTQCEQLRATSSRSFQNREVIVQKPSSVELEREVIDVVKHNCSCEWEQLNSSHLRLWRTGTSEFHYEAKEDD